LYKFYVLFLLLHIWIFCRLYRTATAFSTFQTAMCILVCPCYKISYYIGTIYIYIYIPTIIIWFLRFNKNFERKTWGKIKKYYLQLVWRGTRIQFVLWTPIYSYNTVAFVGNSKTEIWNKTHRISTDILLLCTSMTLITRCGRYQSIKNSDRLFVSFIRDMRKV